MGWVGKKKLTPFTEVTLYWLVKLSKLFGESFMIPYSHNASR